MTKSLKKVDCKICGNSMQIDIDSKSGLCATCVRSGKVQEYINIIEEEKDSKRRHKMGIDDEVIDEKSEKS